MAVRSDEVGASCDLAGVGWAIYGVGGIVCVGCEGLDEGDMRGHCLGGDGGADSGAGPAYQQAGCLSCLAASARGGLL